MEVLKKRPLLLLSAVLFVLAIFVRARVIGSLNLDMELLQQWYAFIHTHGVRGLADPTFSNYPPAYLYLLWLSTLLSSWLSPVIALKLLPTLFDFLSMYGIFLMARMRFRNDEPFFLAALFFLLPTVVLNSTAWGQIDSMFTAFLLVSAYLLMQEKPFWALIAFGVAFSFKAQAVFFLPFLGLMFLKGKVAWYHFLLVPVVYILFAIPTALLGRSWESILFLYVGQVGQFQELSKHAPNLYIFIPNIYYEIGFKVGLGMFLLAMAAWSWAYWRASVRITQRHLMLTALASLALVPFLLPKMHDRYFYPADVFSYAAAIFAPELWFLALLYQFISGLSYTVFLARGPVLMVMIGALINTFAVAYIVREQLTSLKEV